MFTKKIRIASIILVCQVCVVVHIGAQKYQFYKDDKGEVQILGEMSIKEIKNRKSFWVDSIYEGYDARARQLLGKFGREFNKISFQIYIGTGCRESQKLVPEFLKVLDDLKFPESRVHIYALDDREGSYMQGMAGRKVDGTIFTVPTVVAHYGGKELDRIIGEPVRSYEQDLLDICRGEKNYHPNYALAFLLAKHVEAVGLEAVLAMDSCGAAVMMYQELVCCVSELSSLGRRYLDARKHAEAEYVFRLNARLYPDSKEVWDDLYGYYSHVEDWTNAGICLENILKIDPEDNLAKTRQRILANKE